MRCPAWRVPRSERQDRRAHLQYATGAAEGEQVLRAGLTTEREQHLVTGYILQGASIDGEQPVARFCSVHRRAALPSDDAADRIGAVVPLERHADLHDGTLPSRVLLTPV